MACSWELSVQTAKGQANIRMRVSIIMGYFFVNLIRSKVVRNYRGQALQIYIEEYTKIPRHSKI